jgi:hypothetical protein
MPIRISCDCGRALRLRDECAGKRIRCPECQKVLAVPEAVVETSGFNVEQNPKPNQSVSTRPKEPPIPVRPPRDDDDEDNRPRAKRKPLSSDPMLKDYYRRTAKPRRRGPSIAVSPAVITGVLMMVIAVVWFVLALSLGWIFFYPPVMFVLGLVAVVKGFMGYDED